MLFIYFFYIMIEIEKTVSVSVCVFGLDFLIFLLLFFCCESWLQCACVYTVLPGQWVSSALLPGTGLTAE